MTCMMIIICIVSVVNLVITINIKKRTGYYIGKIESMEKKDGSTIVEILPIESQRRFVNEIKANHKIEYDDDIMISGLRDKGKDRKELYLGQLEEVIDSLAVGDSIIFKASYYHKDDYKIAIDELAVDLTLD